MKLKFDKSKATSRKKKYNFGYITVNFLSFFSFSFCEKMSVSREWTIEEWVFGDPKANIPKFAFRIFFKFNILKSTVWVYFLSQ